MFDWLRMREMNTQSVMVTEGGIVTSPRVGLIGHTEVWVRDQGSQLVVGDALNVGDSWSAPAILSVSNGAHVQSNVATIGTKGGSGTVLLENSGTNWTNTSTITVGPGGPGVLVVGFGSSVTSELALIEANGLISGSGTIHATIHNSGIVAPGSSPGILTIDGDYSQNSGGKLKIEIGGTAMGSEYDQLNVLGNVEVDGTLEVTFLPGYFPIVGSTFELLQAASINGTFSTIVAPPGYAFEVSSEGASIIAEVTKAQAVPTTSEWGVAVLALLFATVGTLLVRRSFDHVMVEGRQTNPV